MRKFLKNTKGAVTVFVTLLLIPAILVSGTAVDLSRMHTARSIAHDANQLAANSVLANYDALLQNVYGLFGVMTDDPELAEMINDYIHLSIFGGNNSSGGLGTLQLFYGSDIRDAAITPQEEKHLRDRDVLRRQIEEYMKFRAPVIIVNEFLEMLDGSTLKNDADIIGEKMAIESAFEDIYFLYKRLYEAIVRGDNLTQTEARGGIAGATFGTVSSGLRTIRDQFAELRNVYTMMLQPMEPNVFMMYRQHYNAILVNIRSLTVGGPVGIGWVYGRGWRSDGRSQGLNKTIENAITAADTGKPRFDTVVDIANEVEFKRLQLLAMVNAFEERVRTENIDEELRAAMISPDASGKSQIDRYREILEWENVPQMARAFRDGGYDYIDNILKPALDGVVYRNRNSPGRFLSRQQLANLQTHPSFDLMVDPSLHGAMFFGAIPTDMVSYPMPSGFVRFASHSTQHHEFFTMLEHMMSLGNIVPVKLFDGQDDAPGEDGEESQRNLIRNLLDLVQFAYSGLSNNQLGASYIKVSDTPGSDDFSISDIKSVISTAAGHGAISIFSNPVGYATQKADDLLVLTYATSMFSNYTTARPETIGKTRDDMFGIRFPTSISGALLSPELNYFFQSEWEYLYGDSNSADRNLNAVTRLIFMIRLVCNYITVFSVPQVTQVVNAIRTAFFWKPPLAIFLSELARAAFVAAESVIDVATLRAGLRVPLIKKAALNQWICTPSGLATAVNNIAAGGYSEAFGYDRGLSYSNYMQFFFLTKLVITPSYAGTLADRVGNLIEYNVINYRNHIFSDEKKMAEIMQNEDIFKLENLKTDFSISFTIDMRMLFLSMPVAQRGLNGVIPPRSMPLTTTDYRGY